jgi:hypothetical protein
LYNLLDINAMEEEYRTTHKNIDGAINLVGRNRLQSRSCRGDGVKLVTAAYIP